MSQRKRKPSLDTIAVKCGVSKMTVSRALRNDSGISWATRKMVMEVAAEENYVPRISQKTTNGSQDARYYVLFQQDYVEKGSFFGDLITCIQRELFTEGIGCSLGVIKAEYSEFLRLHSMMKDHQTDGILVVGDAPVEYLNILLESFEGRLVFVDYPGDGRIVRPFSSVVFDNAFGIYRGLEHLMNLGRRRILLLSGTVDHYFSKIMLSTYRDILAHNDIEFDPELVVSGEFHLKSAYRTIRQTLENGRKFDAVFSTDLMACGAINALRNAGIRVPDDVSVVGFDGLPIGEAMRPSLTTVALDMEQMGQLAVRRLRAPEEDSWARFATIALLPSLVIRESCGGKLKEEMAGPGNELMLARA